MIRSEDKASKVENWISSTFRLAYAPVYDQNPCVIRAETPLVVGVHLVLWNKKRCKIRDW